MTGAESVQSVDLAIIGAGVAGLSAAATAAAHGPDVLVIEQMAPGGQIATVETIRNMPGFAEGVGGYELGPLLQQQAEEAGTRFLLDCVEHIAPAPDAGFHIRTAQNMVHARAVIVATGSRRRALNVLGEAALEGRGVSHCASCDGHFFAGKTVIVAGGGDSAFDEAELLAGHAERVLIMHHGASPVAQARTVERVARLPNVEIIAQADIIALEGTDALDHVLVALSDGQRRQAAAGLFVYVGLEPNTSLIADLVTLDDTGRILTDAQFQTSCPGLFVAGDVRSGATALLASVAGDGASAARAALAYLKDASSRLDPG